MAWRCVFVQAGELVRGDLEARLVCCLDLGVSVVCVRGFHGSDMEDDLKCSECLYFQRVEGREESDGDCRWRPKVLKHSPVSIQYAYFTWPPMKVDDWCGQFKPLQGSP